MNDAKKGFTFHHVKNKVHFFMNEPQPKVGSINAIYFSSIYTGATYISIVHLSKPVINIISLLILLDTEIKICLISH